MLLAVGSGLLSPLCRCQASPTCHQAHQAHAAEAAKAPAQHNIVPVVRMMLIHRQATHGGPDVQRVYLPLPRPKTNKVLMNVQVGLVGARTRRLSSSAAHALAFQKARMDFVCGIGRDASKKRMQHLPSVSFDVLARGG